MKGLALFYILLTAYLCSCSGGEFSSAISKSSKDDDPPPEDSEIYVPDDNDKTHYVTSLKGADLLFDPASREKTDEEEKKSTLEIMFALDVTNSMDPVINAIKSNIVAFVDNLEKEDIDAKIGIVTFRDEVADVLPLTDDSDSFRSFVSAQNSNGGGDPNEAALLGIQRAVEVLKESSNSDAVKSVLVITDNPGHEGGAKSSKVVRNDCATDSTIELINNAASAHESRFKFFFSGAPTGRVCSGFTSAEQQFGEILEEMLPAIDKDKKGKSLGWPFTEDTLLDEFSSSLITMIPAKDLLCLSQKAIFEYSDESKTIWESDDLKDVYRKYSDGEKITVRRIFEKLDLDSKTKIDGSLRVKRCCLEKAQVKADDFSSCEEKQESVIKFKIRLQ